MLIASIISLSFAAIAFEGTVAEWQDIEKVEKWMNGLSLEKNVCLDGAIILS
ncbi:MAG: hypothetical protein K6F36_00360 [Bacilli bacterium]|nr:hypothetical protein [Bacilli bacterium]